MENNFFHNNHFLIDEKVSYFKFENTYRVYDANGDDIGTVKQKLTTGQKLLRLLLSKAMLPFTLEIHDASGNVLATISRGWTFFMSKINIHDAQGDAVGSIKQKFAFFKPTFRIFDPSETLLAEITGDWKAWDFKINDASSNLIGTVNKKWAGVMKEVFTSADKYIVSVNPDLNELGHRIAILSSAITIDMVLKESK